MGTLTVDQALHYASQAESRGHRVASKVYLETAMRIEAQPVAKPKQEINEALQNSLAASNLKVLLDWWPEEPTYHKGELGYYLAVASGAKAKAAAKRKKQKEEETN